MSERDWQDVFRRTRAAYHRALVGAARGGMDVVGDHVLNEPWRLADLLDVSEGVDVFLVHLRADLATLERRERERGDRDIGTAAIQQELVYAHGDCDLDIDTTTLPPREAAARITELVQRPPTTRAFDRLRGGLSQGR